MPWDERRDSQGLPLLMLALLFRNLAYHWRGNLAVLLGVALGTAVLTGALLVGDSLRGSLRALMLDRLGWVEEAMLPGRFFRAALAEEWPAAKSAPALLLQGNVTARDGADKPPRRVGKVTVLGIADSFWPEGHVPVDAKFWQSDAAEVLINRALADTLRVETGAELTLHVQKAESIPRESLLGKRRPDDAFEALRVKVRAVLPDEGMARFTLRPTPAPALNVFVPLRYLQSRLDLKGKANAILAAGVPVPKQDSVNPLKLEDWNLRLRTPKDRALALWRYLSPRDPDAESLPRGRWRDRVPDVLAKEAQANGNRLTRTMVDRYVEQHHPYVSLESGQMFLEPAVVRAARIALEQPADAQSFGPGVQPIFVYLADKLADGNNEVPYAVVAGIGPDKTLPKNEREEFRPALKDDEMALALWPDSPMRAKIGDTVRVVYYTPDERNHLERREKAFVVRHLFPLIGSADDPDLTPEFPGITDKLDMASWENPPFPYDPKRVRNADEEFWKRYRTTPRAYVSLKTAQQLWGSRFGDLTSLQINSSRIDPDEFAKRLVQALSPASGGFVFQPVRQQAEEASAGSNDFGWLFVGFSCFLIASALLLVGLLFRLNVDRRATELGLLLATGWSHSQARRLLLDEGSVVAMIGTLAGLGGALLYARLMLDYLQSNWPGGADLMFLRLHVRPLSLLAGFSASLAVSLLTIYWATRILGRLAPRALLMGQTAESAAPPTTGRSWVVWLIPIGLVGAIAAAVVGFLSTSHEAQAGSFFGSGALLLTACLAGVWLALRRLARRSTTRPSLTALGVRNAGRYLTRSLLTVGLLAGATFVVVAVESFHKDAGAAFANLHGGSGGFPLYAESDVPFYQDLNQPSIRADLKLDHPDLTDVRFFACRVRAGADTSCLNLYQPLRPRVLAIPPALVRRDGFHFGATLAETDEQKANPWLLLDAKQPDGTVPAILDATTAQWVLHVGLGNTLAVDDGQGGKASLRVVALLQDSIFQSEVLISERNFLKLYPRHEGFNFVLIDPGEQSPAKLGAIEVALSQSLSNLGLEVQPTAARVQSYQAVENAYLATFQMLGGLGLLLGALGLAIVLLRGVWERRSELALLRALGFRPTRLAWLVLAENVFLLLLGLLAGVGAALLAVAPHLLGRGAEVLWLRIALLLTAVLSVGLLAGTAAVFASIRAPVIEALRRE